MRRIIVVVADRKIPEICLVFGINDLDHFLGRGAKLLGTQHGASAMGIVSTDIDAFMTAHALESHPDICLDVLHEMAEVNRAVCVGQGAGDEDSTLVHDIACLSENLGC